MQKDAAAVEKIAHSVQKKPIAVENAIVEKISEDENLHVKNSDLE